MNEDKEKNDNISGQDEIIKINETNDFDDNNLADVLAVMAEDEAGTTREKETETETEYETEIESADESDPEIKEKHRDEKSKIRYLPVHIFAFAVPFILMMIAFNTIKIYPFGDRQIMVVDSWHQYYPFLQELQYKLTHGQSLLYSWNTGAGTNFLTLMAYYASTPLYLFSVLFPQKYLREFMMLVTAVKISCSGLFFSIYLRGLYNQYFRKDKDTESDSKRSKKYCSVYHGLAIIGFSVLYAVSAYAVGYYWCIMWLDCMAMLPLIILGLENFIEKGKYKLYIIALGVTVVCDYYIAIFVCEFIALYYIVLYFTKIKKPSFFGFAVKTAKVIGASIVGVGLSMFILFPTFLWFSNTGNAGSTFSREITTYNTLLDIVTNLLPNTTPAIRAGLPNIACGLITVILAGLYFINSKIKLREKLFTAGFLIFMLFSFNINILDYYWHGMHFPNEIPYRQAFVFTFVLVTIAYKSFMTFDNKDITRNTVMKLSLCILGYLIVAEQWYKSSDKFGFKVFYVSIAVLIVYMVILMLYKSSKMPKTYLALILMFAMIFEGGMSAVKGAATTGTSDRVGYAPAKDNIQKMVDYIYKEDQDKFFRLEMTRWYSTNDPALYGYRGISQFSSEANGKFARTLEVLGIAATITSNRFLYSSATPVFNSFMSLKYLMSRDDEVQHGMDSVVFDEFHRIATTEEIEGNEDLSRDTNAVTAYKNKYWLPLGFIVSEDIKETNINESNPFILQNELMKKASGIMGDVFDSIYQAYNTDVNLTESRGAYGVYSYSITDKSQKGTVNHVYTSDKNQQVYAYLKSTRSKTAYVSVNGTSKNYEVNRGITIDCGMVAAGENINIYFDVDPGDSGTFNLFVVGFDEGVFKEGYDILNSGSLNVQEFSDTNIKGTVNAQKDGVFFTSIPYDKGWHLKIDGKVTEINPKSAAEINDVTANNANNKNVKKPDPRQIKKITDGFITAPITAGEHTIELYYVTDGLIPGALISALCIMIIVVLEIVLTRNRKSKSKREELEESEE